MRKYIKILKWLMENKEKLEKLIENKEKKATEKDYSLAGVPEFQLEYINDMLEADKKQKGGL